MYNKRNVKWRLTDVVREWFEKSSAGSGSFWGRRCCCWPCLSPNRCPVSVKFWISSADRPCPWWPLSCRPFSTWSWPTWKALIGSPRNYFVFVSFQLSPPPLLIHFQRRVGCMLLHPSNNDNFALPLEIQIQIKLNNVN